MAYIALKPVRFSKDYAIGEIIPEKDVNPSMAKNLIGWGKIAAVGDNAANSPVTDPNLNDTGEGIRITHQQRKRQYGRK